jgi:hypothetical protein
MLNRVLFLHRAYHFFELTPMRNASKSNPIISNRRWCRKTIQVEQSIFT